MDLRRMGAGDYYRATQGGEADMSKQANVSRHPDKPRSKAAVAAAAAANAAKARRKQKREDQGVGGLIAVAMMVASMGGGTYAGHWLQSDRDVWSALFMASQKPAPAAPAAPVADATQASLNFN